RDRRNWSEEVHSRPIIAYRLSPIAYFLFPISYFLSRVDFPLDFACFSGLERNGRAMNPRISIPYRVHRPCASAKSILIQYGLNAKYEVCTVCRSSTDSPGFHGQLAADRAYTSL